MGPNARKVVAQIETPRSPEPVMRRPSADREEKRVTRGRYDPEKEQEQLDVNDPNQRGLLGARDYDKDAPVRIEIVVKIAFPDGSMGVKGLRKERDAGRLETEIIANKEYTTLAAIAKMRDLCRVRKASAFTSEKRPERPTAALGARPNGSSMTEIKDIPLASARATLLSLK
ncbi:hypothetical protein GCM10007937_45210 [Mesorhizobium albiziae]|nr:hypothetical protein GCM10007937_45210 [Mesorhizobium albiziae]